MRKSHRVRRAQKKEQVDCCGDRHECNVEFVCSCGLHGCKSCIQDHLLDIAMKGGPDGR